MCADVGDRSKSTAVLGQDAPVEVGVTQKPVLNIAARDVPPISEPAFLYTIRSILTERIEPDLVGNRGG